jgi:hypothetical protein
MAEVSETSVLTPIKHPAMLWERASGIARGYYGWCPLLSWSNDFTLPWNHSGSSESFRQGGGSIALQPAGLQEEGAGGALAPSAEFGVPRVTQGIPEEIEAQHCQTDGQAWKDREPGCLFHKRASGAAQHQTP